MHSTKSAFIAKSTKYEGVTFKVRTLNTIKRAERDARIAQDRLEYTRLTSERATQFRALVGEDGTVEELNAKANALPIGRRLELLSLDEQAQHIFERVIIPSTIRAAFVSIEGYEIDGKAPTVDDLLENAPDDLLGEVYAACVTGSGLTEGEAKN